MISCEFKDNKGRKYKNVYLNNEKEAIFCFNGVNHVFKVNPVMVLREGNSEFGDQLLFQFIILKKIKEYATKGDHDLFELYLSKKEGIEILERALEYFKGKEDIKK